MANLTVEVSIQSGLIVLESNNQQFNKVVGNVDFLVNTTTSKIQFKRQTDNGTYFGGHTYYWNQIFDENGVLLGTDLATTVTALRGLFFLTSGSNELGTILSDDFARLSLGDWTEFGASSFVPDGSKLVMSGGTGVFTDYIQYEQYITCLELWQIVVQFKAVTQNGTSYGLGIGMKSVNTFDARGMRMQFGVVNGFLYIVAGTQTEDNSADATKALTVSAGDDLVLTVNRRYNTYTMVVQNITTQVAKTFVTVYSLNYAVSSSVPHNTAKFAIFNYGGTMNVTSFVFKSVQSKAAKCLFVGDSITYGAFASDNSGRFANIVSSIDGIVNTNGGASDTTAEVLARIDELISLEPKRIALMIGGNDVFFGVSSVVYEANYIAIRNALVAAGIEVVHLLATPRITANMIPLNTFISTSPALAGDTVIDTYTNLVGGYATYYAIDQVHPNILGNQKIADAILTQKPDIVS